MRKKIKELSPHLNQFFLFFVFVSFRDVFTHGSLTFDFSYSQLMTVEESQRKQRMEKERDRKQKLATAELLSNYRLQGLSEEEIKMKVLREEERRKKMDAEQRLREFKKLDEPMANKTRAQRSNNNNNQQDQQQDQQQHIPPPVNAGGGGDQDTDDPITFGSVSAIKANFTGNGGSSSSQLQQQQYQQHHDYDDDDFNRSRSDDRVHSMEEVMPSTTPTTTTTIPSTSSRDAYQESSSRGGDDGGDVGGDGGGGGVGQERKDDPNTTTTTNTATAAATTAMAMEAFAPTPTSFTEDSNVDITSGQGRGGGGGGGEGISVEGGSATVDTPRGEGGVINPTTPWTTTTVYFKFGVISTQIDNHDSQVLLIPYKRAMESILSYSFASSTDIKSRDGQVPGVRIQTIQRDDNFAEQRQKQQHNHSIPSSPLLRSTVKRIVVTVAVDVEVMTMEDDTAETTTGTTHVEMIKQHIYRAIGNAIQTGRLLELSKHYAQE